MMSSSVSKVKSKTSAINYDNIDKALVKAIDQLSSTNKRFWSSPEHDRRDNVHSFFQYPAMMVPVVQMELIKTILSLRPDVKTMIDPYMGSATSIVAAMQSNLICYGQDVNPLAILLSKVKTGSYQYEAFRKRAEKLIASAKKNTSRKILRSFPGRSKWFKQNVAVELSRLVSAIRKEKSIAARRLFWVTLAETVRLTSNDRTSTYKLHARPLEEIENRNLSPITVFEDLIVQNIEDIKKHALTLKELSLTNRGAYVNDISISMLDSTTKIKLPLRQGKSSQFDLLVSSPPYGDNKTTIPYGQHAYLPLQWIDLNDIDAKLTNDILKSTSQIDNLCLGGNLRTIGLKELEALYDKSPTLERVVNRLSKEHRDKIKKVVNFIYDFDRSLDVIAASIKPNGYMIWTIGNRRVGKKEIKNDRILVELLQHRNLKFVKEIKRKILNKRMAKKNSSSSTMNTEKILIFRKVG